MMLLFGGFLGVFHLVIVSWCLKIGPRPVSFLCNILFFEHLVIFLSKNKFTDIGRKKHLNVVENKLKTIKTENMQLI